MLLQTDHEATQTFADKITQTRMDARLAMRAGLRYTPPAQHTPQLPALKPEREYALPEQSRSKEAPLTLPEYVMEPLTLKGEAFAPETLPAEETGEDDAWLNDVAQPQIGPVTQTPIQREQLANEHTLTCWL